ncbi:EF-hand domain pair [Trinorchestia longiramus]|nr:EF-hand domain pair [Trinorchestia longiramus]
MYDVVILMTQLFNYLLGYYYLVKDSTWVRRPYEEDDVDQIPEGKTFLSDFQVEKFTYYFTNVFDHNKDRVITIEDIEALNERMRHYAGWHDDNEYFITMKEIHSDFFECLLEHVGRIEPEYGFEFDVDRIPDRVQMYQWLNMWGNLTHGAKAMIDFPVWLQILPKILFKVINRRGNYESFVCVCVCVFVLPRKDPH